jgi:Flp pilus assembly protein TadG
LRRVRVGERLCELRAKSGQRGQASVEVLGAVPALLMLGLVLFQLLAIGYASSLAGNAAEAGALAVATGEDATDAAHRAVPGWSRARMRVSEDGGRVRVRMSPPSPLHAVSRKFEVEAAAVVAK